METTRFPFAGIIISALFVIIICLLWKGESLKANSRVCDQNHFEKYQACIEGHTFSYTKWDWCSKNFGTEQRRRFCYWNKGTFIRGAND